MGADARLRRCGSCELDERVYLPRERVEYDDLGKKVERAAERKLGGMERRVVSSRGSLALGFVRKCSSSRSRCAADERLGALSSGMVRVRGGGVRRRRCRSDVECDVARGAGVAESARRAGGAFGCGGGDDGRGVAPDCDLLQPQLVAGAAMGGVGGGERVELRRRRRRRGGRVGGGGLCGGGGGEGGGGGRGRGGGGGGGSPGGRKAVGHGGRAGEGGAGEGGGGRRRAAGGGGRRAAATAARRAARRLRFTASRVRGSVAKGALCNCARARRELARAVVARCRHALYTVRPGRAAAAAREPPWLTARRGRGGAPNSMNNGAAPRAPRGRAALAAPAAARRARSRALTARTRPARRAARARAPRRRGAAAAPRLRRQRGARRCAAPAPAAAPACNLGRRAARASPTV
ncbi:hypothetical protein FGB62_4g036 [Gracilaria domingensis]|nr:hypothetical protein FGB62_4g036 [Gracilaria domingensis]